MKMKKIVDVEFAQELAFTDDELISTLNIDKQSANELLTSVIPFEESELEKLATARGVSLKQLIK